MLEDDVIFFSYSECSVKEWSRLLTILAVLYQTLFSWFFFSHLCERTRIYWDNFLGLESDCLYVTEAVPESADIPWEFNSHDVPHHIIYSFIPM